MVGCETTGSVPAFRARGFIPTGSSSTSTSFSWSGPTTIDATAGLAASAGSNNDLSSDCANMFTAGTRGCMQTPQVAYSDSRWFIGFNQNYFSNLAGDNNYSVMVNMTDLTTRLFGTALGTLYRVIDNGAGSALAATASSSRYVRFATFPNGDVVAVYVQDDNTDERTVFATIYDADSDTWGAAQQLGTLGLDTDEALDFLVPGGGGTGYKAHFCRPAVATAGDGTAMAAWCEESTVAGDRAVIKYAHYSNGAWSVSNPLIDLSDGAAAGTVDEATFALPGIHGTYNQYPPAFPVAAASWTIAVNDTFASGIDYGASADVATVTAVAAGASAGQFNIVTDISGTVQVCQTLQNMVNALLTAPVTNYVAGVGTVTTRTLSQANVSAVVNPSCSQSVASTWRVSLYYNRSLSNYVRNTNVLGDSDSNQVIPVIVTKSGTVASMGVGATAADATITANISNGACPAATCQIPRTTPESAVTDEYQLPSHDAAAMVDVAGDGSGNYMLVRSMASSTTKILDISPSGIVSRGRMLVGHEWIGASSNWRLRSIDSVGTTADRVRDPHTSFVSRTPMCFDGSETFPCSVRHPKTLMSDSGHGLVFFYQQQWDKPNSATTWGSANPNRLWYATYGTATGFSSVANTLDDDIFCFTSSTANDESVCETGQFSSTSTEYCMDSGEPSATLGSPLTQTHGLDTLTHDVPQIAAAMNEDGEAVVAFHKRGISSTDSSTCSAYVRLHVRTYDPFNGFGSIETIDDDTGHTMHASVAIAPNGTVAVVWETYVTSTGSSYVYLKTKSNGTWSSATLVNSSSSLQSSTESMMPSVGINDDGEIVVTFSYSTAATARRQYVNYYYDH